MNTLSKAVLMGAASCLIPMTAPMIALAGNVAKCEIVIMQEVVDEDGGIVTVASYRPASDFLKGVYDDDVPLTMKQEDHPIRGVICARNDLIPSESDYDVLATGIPLSLSQNFDSSDSDILTIFYANGRFRHKFTSAWPMGEEFRETLEAQLDDFSARDHGLPEADAASQDGADMQDSETDADATLDPEDSVTKIAADD